MTEFFNSAVGTLLLWAAIIGAASTIWIKGVWPVLKGINAIATKMYQLGQDLPVLQDIAAEFKPNHGKSLHDHIQTLQEDVHYVKLDVAAIRMDDRMFTQRLKTVDERLDRLEAS